MTKKKLIITTELTLSIEQLLYNSNSFQTFKDLLCTAAREYIKSNKFVKTQRVQLMIIFFTFVRTTFKLIKQKDEMF